MFRKIGYGLTLVVLVLVTGGCIVSIGSGGRKRDDVNVHHHDSELVFAEIDAAGSLFSDSDKAGVYKDIAERPHLSGKAQAYLVKESCRHIFSDSSKEEVMIVLIANPCFDDAGKRAILGNLKHLFSDSRKRRVLDAMNEREKRVAEAEVAVEVTTEVSN